jgi:hypothetical protein
MAWGIRGIAGPITVASGNINAAGSGEPTGAAAGDLIIVCIAYRSNAAFSVPDASWNIVATQQSSGDTDATNGIASGLMAWCVRGGSAPNYTFTRTGGDVAQSYILAYTGGHASTPYDTGSANTLGSASATATTGTITTAEAGELIVAMSSHGDTYTSSAFDAATDPATDSGGSSDSSTAPTNGTWLRRGTASTGTGADTGIGVADAVRASAGATGTIQCTVGGSARHVMIAGAFKLAAPAAPRTPKDFGQMYQQLLAQ